jgi:hypothetical protein
MFLWLGSNFTTGVNLLTSKVQAFIWSGADVVLVLAVLKIADLARDREGLGRLAILHLMLWLSALLTPVLLLAQTPGQFFLLECVICGSQFLILLYVAYTERTRILALFLQQPRKGTSGLQPDQPVERVEPFRQSSI